MDDISILINYGGQWKRNTYKDGYPKMVFVPKNLTYKTLFVIVHEIVYVDLNNCVYEIRTLFNTNGKIVRFKIKNDRDVQYVWRVRERIPKVYIIVQHSQQPSNVNESIHAQPLHEPNHQSFVQQEWNEIYQSTHHSFVKLMASQLVLLRWLNPFFDPNTWTRTGPEQHMNKSTIFFFSNEELIVENNDI